jgi:hypothetical protein
VAQLTDTLSPGTSLVGDYDIIRILGSGGFGNTYLAMDRSLNREVAIKEFFPRDIAFRADQTTVSIKNPKFEGSFKWALDRFVQEAKLLAKFRHPNIVRVFRTFEANHTSYIVLDYIRGTDLDNWLRHLRRRPTQQELDDLLVPLLDALALLHEARVLHRDIKPANICVREETGDPVLLDFGASKYSMSELTGTTAAIVSRGYSPYEAYAADSKQQGAWTDIYGLGATVHRALLDAPPPEATERLLNDTMVPLHQQRLPGFRPGFLAAVDWALSVQPRNRPQSVPEWQARLLSGSEAAALSWQVRRLSDPGPDARTQVSGPRAGGSSGRRVAALGLLALLLVGGGGGLAFSLGWIPSTFGPPQSGEEARRREQEERWAALQKEEEARRQREAEEARHRREQEERQAALQRERDEEARRQAALQRDEEARRQAALQKERDEEARRQAARQRDEEARRQAALQKERDDEARRQAARQRDEEARRQAALQKERDEEARRQAALQRERDEEVRRQAALQRERDEEARRKAALRDEERRKAARPKGPASRKDTSAQQPATQPAAVPMIGVGN